MTSSSEITTAQNGFNWFLTEVSGANTAKRDIYINAAEFRVGRGLDSHLTLPYSSVSKSHAVMFIAEGRLYVKELGSTNGTTVNGYSVTGKRELFADDLVSFADIVFRVGFVHASMTTCTEASNVGQWADKLLQFEKLLNGRGAIPYFQPIVQLNSLQVVGQELLARSELDALRNPAEMFEVAKALDQERALSEMMRRVGGEAAVAAGSSCEVFMNTHPIEVGDERLIANLKYIRMLYPKLPIAIEIHEAAVADADGMHRLRETLTDLNMRLAYDDFGAGQSRLIELSEFPPDVLKFDMKLIRNIDRASERHQSMVGRFVEIVLDFGIEPLAEGIETEAEHQVCTELGFVTAQGYYYGRPAPDVLR